MIPSAASSRSALRDTIAGFLPPISTMHGRGHVRRERVEQPHPDLVRAGEDDAVDARVILERLADGLARTHDQVDDAGRHAGVDVGLRSGLTADSGDADDGLKTTVLPASSAAPSGRPTSAIGKLNGLMTANTPCGRRIERVWTVASPRLSIGWS